jgi:SAM-dependent methyltransferase
VSDWLNRLLVDSVSLDIAHDMLMIGQHRLESGAKQTVGKSQMLPYANEAVNGAICLSALHHIPDIPAALREIHQVLKLDGTAVFSEPGIGHSSHPQSLSEMAKYGVMERIIVVNELLDECLKAGFRNVGVQPYLFPPPIYDNGMWQAVDRAGQPLVVARSGLRSAAAWRTA